MLALKQVIFDPYAKTSQFGSLHRNQAIFDHPHKNLAPHKNQAYFDQTLKSYQFRSILYSSQSWCLDTKANLTAIQTLKPSHFRPPQITKSNPILRNHVKSDTPHKNQVNFDPITDIKSIVIPTLISGRFRCPDTKPVQASIHTLETSHF